jgi:16S rRNA (guanine966-N2)-methyltransferase
MESKLQVISGKLRGRKLRIPAGARPTQQRARAAVFNMLSGFRGRRGVVWDAFAGSGAMGIEFISRFSADRAVFTDISPAAVAAVHENAAGIANCDIAIRKQDALAAAASVFSGEIGCVRPGDGATVFIDPPYSNADTGGRLAAWLARNAPAGTIIVWEMEAAAKGRKMFSGPPAMDGLEILRDRTYGRARFLILQVSM